MGNTFARPRPTTRSSARFDSIVQDQPVAGAASGVATGVPVTEAVSAVAAPPSAAVGGMATGSQPSAVGSMATGSPLSLGVTAEKSFLQAGSEHTLLAMLSLKAPPAPDDVTRPPIDLVACIDRSGSMRGEKMSLMKKTLELLVKRAGLKRDDRISLVSFDSSVKLELPLTAMDQAGRAKADGVVKGLHPGSTTNLSGGLLKSIDVLAQSSSAAAAEGGKAATERRTRAVMAFTDGMANEGIRESNQLVAAVSNTLAAASAKVGGPIALYTFGFGSDHNEDCLRNLAAGSGSGGLYYYISTPEDIPTAFADCLGGLTSVVAQNVTLSLAPAAPGVSVKRVLGSTYTRDGSGDVVLGDLFADDEKDVLVEISVPKLDAPLDDAAPVLRATLRGFNVPRAAPDAIDAVLSVARPAVEPANQPVNTALDEQRNRVLVAEAMEEAARRADAGDVQSGRRELERIHRLVAHSASAESSLSHALQAQCMELQEQYTDMTHYRAVGSKMSKMHARSNHVQRANHASADMYASGAKRKALLKSSWASSISRADGSDSD